MGGKKVQPPQQETHIPLFIKENLMPSKTKGGFDKNPQNINRKGRPRKGTTMTEILGLMLDEQKIQHGENTLDGKKAVMFKLYTLAMQGDVAAIKYICDRIDGTPIAAIRQVDANGDDVDTKLEITIVKPKQDES
jgi:hypothetical protein